MSFVGFLIGAALTGVVIYYILNRNKGNEPSKPVLSDQFNFQYSTGVSDTPYQFNFPLAPGSVHYVAKTAPGPLSTMGRLSLKFKLDGGGTLVPTEQADVAPDAKVRLYFQRAGDTMSGAGEYEFYRWWSVPSVVLTSPGEYTITVDFKPENWTSVFGKDGNASNGLFETALENVQAVGFTFGGMFAGHGVFATTPDVKFTITQFMVVA